MPIVLALLGIIVLAVVGGWFLARGAKNREHAVAAPAGPGRPYEELQYVVPEGQDPAAVLLELDHAGFRAAVAEVRGERVISVDCAGGSSEDRTAARSAIGRAGTTLQDSAAAPSAVRFRDEVAPGS